MTECGGKLNRSQVNLTHQGLTWVAPNIPGQVMPLGLGGIGRQANMGELTLPDYQFPAMSTLLLQMRNLYNPGINIGPGNIRAIAKYAVGAVPNDEVMLDWTFGTSISLPAGKVTLTAVEYGVGSGNRNIAVPLFLSAQLVPGPRFSTAAPTLTFAFVLTATVAESMAPPARAKRLLVGDRRGQAASDVIVTIEALNARNTYNLGNAADSAIRTEGVILPGATTMISFVSATGTGNDLITVCFLLDG
jgi:hypothetical protein